VLHGLSEHISIAMTKLNLIQHDALTGLLRPDAFMDKVIQKISSQSKRRQEEGSFAIVMGDVDWFKNYNDRNGHEAGNRCLRELAGVLRSSIRDEDLICRYGGEEFLFFLTGVKTKEEAMLLTERIRQNVEERYFPFQEYQPRNNLTMSFGVTVCIRNNDQLTTPLTKNEIKKIIHYADLAMAEAKGKKTAALRGEEAEKIMTKNKVCLFRPELAKEEEKLDLEAKERPFLEKRRHERYFASTPLIYKENGSHRVTHTINLSLGGAKIPCDRNLSLHKIIDLFLILGEKASPLKGDIVYSEKGGGDYPSFYTGLKFLDLTPHDKLSLLAFFQTLGKKP
jgi:diguanylate cyclase (GGDEF)-like protein